MAEVTCVKTPFNQAVVEKCPSLKAGFRPLFGFRSKEAQAFLARVLPVDRMRYAREIFAFADGVESSLDWKYCAPARVRADPIVVCLPERGGDSGSKHVMRFTDHCRSAGFTTVVFNRRGHADGSLLPKTGAIAGAACVFPRHADDLSDLASAVDHVCKRYPNPRKYLVGFDDLAIDYLAHVGDDSPFFAAASVGADVRVDALKRLLRKRTDECTLIAEGRLGPIDLKKARNATSVAEFDGCFGGGGGVEKGDVRSVKRPLLCVQSAMDALCNPLVVHVETRVAGGWIDSLFGTPWYMRLVVEFLSATASF